MILLKLIDRRLILNKIIIQVEGGVVQAVYSNIKLEIELLELENDYKQIY